MALEQATTGKELIEATQNAVIETADSIAGLIETTAHDIHGQEAFYEHPTFWVAVSFVLVILVLGRPVGKLVKKMLRDWRKLHFWLKNKDYKESKYK